MRIVTMLTVGVCLAFGLQAGEFGSVEKAALADRSRGDYRAAESALRGALADRAVGDGERATLLANLADLLSEEARDGEAALCLSEARQIGGLSEAQRIGILVESAEVARAMRHWGESIALWNQLGEMSEESTQLDEVYTEGLGETWLDAGNLARAEPLLRRSLMLLREDPRASLPQVAHALALMGRLYIAEDKPALAGEALDEAIAKDEQALGAGHPQVAELLELRAAALARDGDADGAREDLARARAIMAGHFGADSMAVAGVLAALGDVEQRDRHPAEAVAEYRQAIAMLRAGGGDGERLSGALMPSYAAAAKAAHISGETTAEAAEAADALTASAEARSFRGK